MGSADFSYEMSDTSWVRCSEISLNSWSVKDEIRKAL